MRKRISWKTVTQKNVFSDHRLGVRLDEVVQPNGKPGSYMVVEKQDAVLIIPKIGNNFYFVEQDRYPVGERLLEFPMGGIENDETPEIAARRELEEEVGIRANKLVLLGHLWLAPRHHTQGYSVFLAENGTLTERSPEDTEKDMLTKTLTENEIIQKIVTGELKDSNALAAFALYHAIEAKKNISQIK